MCRTIAETRSPHTGPRLTLWPTVKGKSTHSDKPLSLISTVIAAKT
jgi:hypothetical protein